MDLIEQDIAVDKNSHDDLQNLDELYHFKCIKDYDIFVEIKSNLNYYLLFLTFYRNLRLTI